MNKTKEKIAYLLSGRYSYNYQENLKYINENRYICIDKVPIRILLEGILEAIPESSIPLIKEVILEALQLNGIEQTFSDEDWNKLNLIPYMRGDYEYTTLNTDKTYCYEFFEP